jgi:hypothetical protein
MQDAGPLLPASSLCVAVSLGTHGIPPEHSRDGPLLPICRMHLKPKCILSVSSWNITWKFRKSSTSLNFPIILELYYFFAFIK